MPERRRIAAACLLAATATTVANAQALRLPPSAGVSIVQTLSTPDGDRESVHTVVDANGRALRWTWGLVEVLASGDTLRRDYRYVELRADIDASIRLRAYHERDAPEEHPGYTMHAISRAVYRRLLSSGSDTFQVMTVEGPSGGLASFGFAKGVTPMRWRGTLSVVTPSPAKFPLLVNGQRVEVPALHLRGRFRLRNKTWEPQLWVLADTTYPLLLKWVGAHTSSTNTLQTTHVNLPGIEPALERGLSSSCRVELPGIYFAFNSAVLDTSSERTLAAVAALLVRQPTWALTLEGHTDSIGSGESNRVLSERRVGAVKSRLLSRHHVDGARLSTMGLGSTKPREPNETIEGRARNRRVELVRDCAGRR